MGKKLNDASRYVMRVKFLFNIEIFCDSSSKVVAKTKASENVNWISACNTWTIRNTFAKINCLPFPEKPKYIEHLIHNNLTTEIAEFNHTKVTPGPSDDKAWCIFSIPCKNQKFTMNIGDETKFLSKKPWKYLRFYFGL